MTRVLLLGHPRELMPRSLRRRRSAPRPLAQRRTRGAPGMYARPWPGARPVRPSARPSFTVTSRRRGVMLEVVFDVDHDLAEFPSRAAGRAARPSCRCTRQGWRKQLVRRGAAIRPAEVVGLVGDDRMPAVDLDLVAKRPADPARCGRIALNWRAPHPASRRGSIALIPPATGDRLRVPPGTRSATTTEPRPASVATPSAERRSRASITAKPTSSATDAARCRGYGSRGSTRRRSRRSPGREGELGIPRAPASHDRAPEPAWARSAAVHRRAHGSRELSAPW